MPEQQQQRSGKLKWQGLYLSWEIILFFLVVMVGTVMGEAVQLYHEAKDLVD